MLSGKVINFMRWRNPALLFSAVMVMISIIAIATRGLNFGMDFTGGTLVELHYSQAVSLDSIRQQLNAKGFEGAVVVNYGSEQDLLVRLKPEKTKSGESTKSVSNLGDQIVMALREASPDQKIDLMRTEMVGAQMGEEMSDSAFLGLLVALFAVFVYVAVRFQMKFSIGAIAALAHDALVTVGFFAITQLEFDLTVLAAVLAVIGYSINDSIVVADRVRENFRMMREGEPVDIVNHSLTQTLGRTTITSGTTLLAVMALYFVGGELIHNFAIALLVGIGFGTYSSVYVSIALTLVLKLTKEDLMPPIKEGSELDELP